MNAIFDGLKLQLQYRACKSAAISVQFYRRDIGGVSSSLLKTDKIALKLQLVYTRDIEVATSGK